MRARRRDVLLRHLVDLQYERNDIAFGRGKFRVRGDTLEVQPAYAETAYRIEFWGDTIERLTEIQPLTGEILAEHAAHRDLSGQAIHHVGREDAARAGRRSKLNWMSD